MRKSSLFLSMVVVTSLIFTVSCVSKKVPVTETYYETEYRTEQYADVEKVVTVVKGEDELKPAKYWYSKDLRYGTTTKVDFFSQHEHIWYRGYDLPQHNASQLVLDIPPRATQYYSSVVFTPTFLVDVYDVTKVGHLPEWYLSVVPKCTKYYDVHEPTHTWTDCNVTEDTLAEFEVWLDSVNSQLKSATRLGGVDSSFMILAGKPPYIYDVTGIKTLVIIAAGDSSQKNEMDPIKSVKLVWSDVITEEKAVTRERQVPYQVERQRTVTQTKKVPFWEVIFNK